MRSVSGLDAMVKAKHWWQREDSKNVYMHRFDYYDLRDKASAYDEIDKYTWEQKFPTSPIRQVRTPEEIIEDIRNIMFKNTYVGY